METIMNKTEIDGSTSARRAEGMRIVAETAEVELFLMVEIDPSTFEPKFDRVRSGYFARAPGSDIWVEFCDLPDRTREKLWAAHEHKLAFPAGLSGIKRS
jgi:hypothetical protein